MPETRPDPPGRPGDVTSCPHPPLQRFASMGHLVALPYAPVVTTLRHVLLPRGSPPMFYGGADRAAYGRDQAGALASAVGFFKGTL